MISSAIERRRIAKQPGAVECVACGGTGEASKGGECVPCKGTGSIQTDLRGKGAGPIVQHSSESAEHYTPSPIVEAARSVLGAIDLDPASCSLANEVVRAAAFYGPGGLAPDGLAEPWIGRVFLNPPGGNVPDEYKGCGTKSNAALWWATLAEAWRTGEVESAIFVGFMLEVLRSAQGLDVPQPIDFPLCVPSNRIAFDKPVDGVRVGSKQPSHVNVIVFLPPKIELYRTKTVAQFGRTFGAFGRCRV